MTAPHPRAGALAQRLAALLCLTGAGMLGLAAAVAHRFEAAPDGAGDGTLDPAAVTVLLACTGVLSLAGVVLLLLSPAPLRTTLSGRAPRRRPALVLLLGVAALLAALAVRRFGF